MSLTRLHHVGYVTASIAGSVEEYANATGLAWDGRIIHDPLQMVSVAFLSGGDEKFASVELVEPAGPRSPVNRFLAAGGGLHHICIEVDDLNAHIKASVAAGCTLVRVPLPAAAFSGRKIAWITTSTGQLVELLQRP
jgi:methylmalonyl-CoA/ethylmalonyl-CoA epimerase